MRTKNAANYDKTNANYPNNIAACLVDLDRPEDALPYLQRARACPRKDPGIEVCIVLNTAEIHHKRGEHAAARTAFAEALAHVDLERLLDLFNVAQGAALIGAEDDAVEFAARFLAATRKIDLGESPAIEFLRACPDDMKDCLAKHEALWQAIVRVGERYDAPIPPEHQIVTSIELPPAALAVFEELVDDRHAPPRRPFDGPRP